MKKIVAAIVATGILMPLAACSANPEPLEPAAAAYDVNTAWDNVIGNDPKFIDNFCYQARNNSTAFAYEVVDSYDQAPKEVRENLTWGEWEDFVLGKVETHCV